MNKNIVVFIIATLLCLSAQSFPIPKNGEAKFDIVRKNKVIGTHEIFFLESKCFAAEQKLQMGPV